MPDTFQFKPATREAAKLLIGLCGPSGSGKTLSALKLATGLGGKVAYIDTEQGRALQYAGDYQFLHCVLPPPFSPQRYTDIVDAAVNTGAKVVIIDSVSHVWEGPGGILEQVDEARKRSDERNAFSVWAGPKQAHQRLVNRMLQIPAHVILCFRAKEKKGLAPGNRGKMEVVDLGWHPICEQGMVYELTINALLSTEKKGAPIINGFDFGKLPYNMAHLLPNDVQISEATGRNIAAWCAGGGTPEAHSGRLDALEQTLSGVGEYPPARLPAVDLVNAAADDIKGDDPSDHGSTGSGGSAPSSAWDAGKVEKSQAFRIPLVDPTSGETRFFPDIPAWCNAMCELANAPDPYEVWKANSEAHNKLTMAKTNDPTWQGHLKAAADYVHAAIKAEQNERGPA